MPLYGLPFSDEQLFQIINVVLPGWLLVAFAPRWRHTQTIAALCAMVPCIVYTASILSMLVSPSDSAKLDLKLAFTYEGVHRILSNKALLVPCWFHYAGFDLWVARWAAADATSRGVPFLLYFITVPFIMFLGPVGLVMYMLVRAPFNQAANKDKIA